MSFYHSQKGVADYLEMAAGYDGQELVDRLADHLESDSTVLELGMGPGVDLDLLNVKFDATGSDFSPLFLDRYRTTHPGADLIRLDAITLATERQFDALFSNKVLHHLSDEELAQSTRRQFEILNPGGLLMHSFWYGSSVEEHAGMRFYYHDEEFLQGLYSGSFEIIESRLYQEMEVGDSIYVLARRRSD